MHDKFAGVFRFFSCVLLMGELVISKEQNQRLTLAMSDAIHFPSKRMLNKHTLHKF